jgi:hypothetical protein
MALFVTLEAAKDHLRVTDDASNADIELKLDQAEGIILQRCNSTAWWRAITPTWTADTVPPAIQSAILLLLTHLYEHRGDDSGSSFRTPATAVWDAVDRLISPNSDPVLA